MSQSNTLKQDLIGSLGQSLALLVATAKENLAKEMASSGMLPSDGWSIAEFRQNNFEADVYEAVFWPYHRSRDEQRLDMAHEIVVPMHG